MNITTTASNFDASPALDTFIRDELRGALTHVRADIVAVDVFMEDINGPKGGVDKQARVRIRLRTGRVISIQSQREDLYQAVRNAIQRAKRAVRRHLRKSRRIGAARIAALVRQANGRVATS